MKPLIEGYELDLRLGDKAHTHPDLNTTDQYLCLINNQWFIGKFFEAWFGLSFSGWHNTLQYDKPGTNNSRWQRIIQIKIN